MVAMCMGSTKRGVVWCAVLLVAGLLLVAADADFCSEDCRGKLDFWGCVRKCRSQLDVARPTTNCVALCHGKPNFIACCNRHRHVRRAPLHLRRDGRESTRHGEEQASGGAVGGVLKAPAPAPCEVVCRDQPDWVAYERCLDRCQWGAYVRRALLHLQLAGRESATHEEVLTAMAARLSDACQDQCHNHAHFDWCVRRCRFGPHLRLAGGESEEASGGAVDDRTARAAVAEVDPKVCEDFCRNWPAPDHDWCIGFCMIGAYVQRAPLHLKLAGGESATHEEGEEEEEEAAAQAMSTDPCDDYCMEQTRYFPRPGQFFDCVEECHAGHGRLAGDGRNGILRRVEQELEKSDDQVQLGRGGANGDDQVQLGRGGTNGDDQVLPAAAVAAVQHEAAAAGAQPVNTETCESYCKWHARDFPAKYTACVRQCESQSGGHPGDGKAARVKQEGHKEHGGEVHLGRGNGKKIAIE